MRPGRTAAGFLALSALFAPALAWSQQERWVDLLHEQADITLVGAAAGGRIVSVTTGDVNRDGAGDLIFGMPGAGGEYGSVGVVLGPLQAGLRDLVLEPPDLTLVSGEAYDQFGEEVLSFDLNGDGYDEVVISARAADHPDGSTLTGGRVYVFFGAADLPSWLDLGSHSEGLVIYPASGAWLKAWDLASGDLDHDGHEDLVIGPGTDGVNVIFADEELDRVGDIEVLLTNYPVGGSAPAFGRFVAAGDLNGDGLDDLVLAASTEVDVVLGQRPEPGDGPQEPLPVALRVLGGPFDAGAGVAVADFNADGFDDLAIASPNEWYQDRQWAGRVHLIYGAAELPALWDLGVQPADLSVVGATAGEALSGHPDGMHCNLSTGDMDLDGRADLVVGAVGATATDGETRIAGTGYVLFGRALDRGIRDLAVHPAEITLHGAGWRDYLGWDTAAADLDGDCVDDAAYVALRADGPGDERSNAGEIHIILGPGPPFDPGELATAIQSLPAGVFGPMGQGRREALTHQAEAIERLQRAGQTAAASKLLARIAAHLEPCMGAPGEHDLIQDCSVRAELRCLLQRAKKALAAD